LPDEMKQCCYAIGCIIDTSRIRLCFVRIGKCDATVRCREVLGEMLAVGCYDRCLAVALCGQVLKKNPGQRVDVTQIKHEFRQTVAGWEKIPAEDPMPTDLITNRLRFHDAIGHQQFRE